MCLVKLARTLSLGGGKKRFGFIWTSKEKEIEVREGEKKVSLKERKEGREDGFNQ